MATITLSEGEIQTFAGKLEAFGDSLSPKEQILLAEILSRAASADEDDVEGHMVHEGLPRLRTLPWSDVHPYIHSVVTHVGSGITAGEPHPAVE